MTESEIMKALECCKMPVGSGSCNHCPLKETREKRVSNEDKSCTTIALENALDLLNRKNAEIEALQAENKDIVIIRGEGGKIVEKGHIVYLTVEQIEQRARYEVIKEFAERVKKLIVMCYYDLGDLEDTMLLEKDIDQIAKEMGVEL